LSDANKTEFFLSDLDSSNDENDEDNEAPAETSSTSTLTSNTSNSSSNEDDYDESNKSAKKSKRKNKSRPNMSNISGTSSHTLSPNRLKMSMKANRSSKSSSKSHQPTSQKAKEKDSFWDSLDATIDSVARNFGTPGALNNTTGAANQSLADNDIAMSPALANKSILSASLCSPSSVTAISSPSSSPLPVQQPQLNKLNSPTVNSPPQAFNSVLTSPLPGSNVNNKRRPSLSSSSSIGSPLKPANSGTNATFKRSKSNLASVEPLGPPPPMETKAPKKRKKEKTTPDSTSLNIADLNTGLNKALNDDTNQSKGYNTKEKMHFLAERKRGLNEKNFKHLRQYLIRKKRFLLKINKLKHANLVNFVNKGKLDNNASSSQSAKRSLVHNASAIHSELRRRFLANSLNRSKYRHKSLNKFAYLGSLVRVNARYNSSSGGRRPSCADCKLKFNARLENQIKLKHKKYDLLNENVPLAFDLVDKCQLNVCTSSSICNSSSSCLNPQASCCARCATLLKPTSNKCSCCSTTSTTANSIASSANNLKSLKSKSLSSSLSLAVGSLQSSHIFGNVKLEPMMNETVASTSEEKPLVNAVSTRFECFHRRKCYFDHHKLDNNYMLVRSLPISESRDKLNKHSYIRLDKRIKLNKNSSGSHKPQTSMVSKTKTIRINANRDELDGFCCEDSDDNKSSLYSTDFSETSSSLSSNNGVVLDLDDIDGVVNDFDDDLRNNQFERIQNYIGCHAEYDADNDEASSLNADLCDEVYEPKSLKNEANLEGLLRNLETDNEDVSLNSDDEEKLDENGADGMLGCDELSHDLADSGSSSSSSSSSLSSLSKKLKKCKRVKQERESAAVSSRAQRQPDYLTNYQFFERDDDDSLFSEEVSNSLNKLKKSKIRINSLSSNVGSSSSGDDSNSSISTTSSSNSSSSSSCSSSNDETSVNNSSNSENESYDENNLFRLHTSSLSSSSRACFGNLTNKFSRKSGAVGEMGKKALKNMDSNDDVMIIDDVKQSWVIIKFFQKFL
jgi:hypothetical protein